MTNMSTTDLILLIAIGEFLLLLLLVLGATVYFFIKRRKQDSRATHNLINKIQAGKAQRTSELSGVLEKIYNIQGDELHIQTQKLIRLENQFYQKFIRTYLTRDANAVEIIDEELKNILNNYTQLANITSHDTGAEQVIEYIEKIEKNGLADSEHGQAGQFDTLKTSVQQMSEELKLYRVTLNRLFFEYAVIFGINVDPRNLLSAKEVLRRLESGQLADTEELDEQEGAGEPTSSSTRVAGHKEVVHPPEPLESQIKDSSVPKPIAQIEQEAEVSELIKSQAQEKSQSLQEIEAEERAEIDAFEEELARFLDKE